MDKTNGSRTHMHHTCTYTLPVILEPHTCYKHRNYCKHSTTLFPVLLQAMLFSGTDLCPNSDEKGKDRRTVPSLQGARLSPRPIPAGVFAHT